MRFMPRESNQFWSAMELTAPMALVQTVQRELEMCGDLCPCRGLIEQIDRVANQAACAPNFREIRLGTWKRVTHDDKFF